MSEQTEKKVSGSTVYIFCPHCQRVTEKIPVVPGRFKDFAEFLAFLFEQEMIEGGDYFYMDPDMKQVGGADVEFRDGTTYTFFIDREKDIMMVQKKEDDGNDE
jgi:hypothetical protein